MKLYFLFTILIVSAVRSTAGPGVTVGASTSHGGSVVNGSGTVFIGGQPMAKVGSQQNCPLIGANSVPHSGGQIYTGSTTVRVNGSPAALNGSFANCVGATCTINGNRPSVRVN
jgi:uncharacterized Zn-binding protein involved in type VI secretion